MSDQITECREALRALADGLHEVADTLHLSGKTADTVQAILALASKVDRVGRAMGGLPRI